jgi:diguanylate cyclase (GGDEF)-like protein/PAS domain S-box-containing protein
MADTQPRGTPARPGPARSGPARLDARALLGDADMSALLAVPCWVYDEETWRILAVNDAALSVYGWTREEFLGMRLTQVRAADESPSLEEDLARLTQTPSDEVRRHRTKDGRGIWVRIRSRPVSWGERAARFAMVTDVTAEHQARIERDRARAFADAVLDATPEAVVIAGTDGVISRVNDAAVSMFGLPRDGLVGASLERFMPPAVGAQHEGYVQAYLRGEPAGAAGTIRRVVGRRADGSRFPVELALAEVEEGDGVAFAAMLRDLTAEEHARAELQRAASVDTLTGLPRRSMVEAELESALREALPVAVILVDLDRFHLVNDGFGSEAGDTVLRAVARSLSEVAIDAGAHVCRSGGDEFLTVAPRTSAPDAVALAGRLVAAVERPVELGPGRVVPQARAGVSVRSRPGTSVHALVAEAYGAARSAKGRYERKVAISARGQADAARRSLDSEDALRRAIAGGEFTAAFQPVVRLADGAVVAAEALVRWQQPDRLVLPAAFIPLAEETGLIVDIGAQVLDHAAVATARVLAAARGARRAWRTWMNVSARELGPDLVVRVTDGLARHGVDPTHFGVELTETALLSAEELNAELLEEFHHAGVLVALDDFGTGYSSLSFLRQLPADVVKVDRSFVDHMDTDPGAAAIVRALVTLGASLGLDVVAEGVERPEEAALLRELGCPYAQGLLFGRPDTADALLHRLGR